MLLCNLQVYVLIVYKCMCYLYCSPTGALTDVGHTEAEAVGAAERMSGLQVVETWFTQITVCSHHIHLRRSTGEPSSH